VSPWYRVHMTLDSMPITNHALQHAGGTAGADGDAAAKGGGAGGVQTGFPLG